MDAREYGDGLVRQLLDNAVHGIVGCVGLGLSLVGDRERTSRAATGVAAELDPLQWRLGTGPTVQARDTQQPVETTSLDGWPALASAAEAALGPGLDQVRGILALPGVWGTELPVILTAYCDRPIDADVREGIDRHEALLAQGLALTEYCAGESLRANQMLQMTQHRRVIEQAKGLVMGLLGCDAAEAFSTLTRASQHFNVRLRTLCIGIVELVGGTTAERHVELAGATGLGGVDDGPSTTEREAAARVWAALQAESR